MKLGRGHNCGKKKSCINPLLSDENVVKIVGKCVGAYFPDCGGIWGVGYFFV